jgi:predicted RNA-binding Zn-ribbon protein involved in translation (DUF1610 family)
MDDQIETVETPDVDPPDLPPDDFDSDDDNNGGDGEPIRWTTVATYWNPTEAHIARLKLESEEIDCIIFDENIVATQWIWANAVGGVKLQVPEEDLIRARQMLATSTQKSLQRAAGEPLFDGQARCPQCGSEDIHSVRLSRKIAMLTLLLLGMPLPFLHRREHCAACGFEWKRSTQ